jgi:hypothetical protein
MVTRWYVHHCVSLVPTLYVRSRASLIRTHCCLVLLLWHFAHMHRLRSRRLSPRPCMTLGTRACLPKVSFVHWFVNLSRSGNGSPCHVRSAVRPSRFDWHHDFPDLADSNGGSRYDDGGRGGYIPPYAPSYAPSYAPLPAYAPVGYPPYAPQGYDYPQQQSNYGSSYDRLQCRCLYRHDLTQNSVLDTKITPRMVPHVRQALREVLPIGHIDALLLCR